MIRTFGLLDEFTSIQKIGTVYKVCWDLVQLKNPIYAEITEEEREAGVEPEILDYEESNYGNFMVERFFHKPTLEEIKTLILTWYNDEVDQKIIDGFVWNGMQVWLSGENQFNYKAAYDLAIQTSGATLPVTFKFGTTDNPVYHTFTSVEELSDFYMQAIQYINEKLAEGWDKKDSINWDDYKIED